MVPEPPTANTSSAALPQTPHKITRPATDELGTAPDSVQLFRRTTGHGAPRSAAVMEDGTQPSHSKDVGRGSPPDVVEAPGCAAAHRIPCRTVVPKDGPTCPTDQDIG